MFAEQDYLDDLFAFISRSPTACHAAASGAALIAAHGFTRLSETDHWGELAAGSYYLLRDDASLIAWTLTGPAAAGRPLRLAGAHTDSPALKVKPNPVQLRHGCVQLGVEVYGGALLNPWFDRDLSLAGRVVWQQAGGPLAAGLIDFRRPVACIPSLAIHLDREVNDKRAIDRQTALVPLFMQADGDAPDFRAILGEQLAAEHPDTAGAEILDFDLFLYDPQPPARIGLRGEFISGPRLDNLVSCHALLRALVQTAEREVAEETGIEGRVLVTLGTIEYWFTTPSHRIHKMVHHYLLEATGGRLTIENDPDQEAIDAIWVPLDEVHRKLTFPNERRIARVAWDRLAGTA